MKLKYSMLGVILLIALYVSGQTSPNCSPWVKTVEQYYRDGQPVSLRPEHLKFRKAILTIDSIVKKNPNFSSISPARFRSSLVISTGVTGYTQINVKAYNKDGWDNKCGIIPQADRIAADKAGISFSINQTGLNKTSLETSATVDDKLNAFKEPVITRTIGGLPYYYHNPGTHFLLIAYDGKVPWEPVTQSEYFDFIERKLKRRINEHADNSKPALTKTKDPKKNSYYLELKKTDPRAAEEFLKLAEATIATYEASLLDANKLREQESENLQKNLEEFRALRAGYSPGELKQQAIRGNSKFGLYTDEFPTIKDPLVKLRKEYLSDLRTTTNIKIISVWAGGTDPEWNEHVQKTLETLDYKAIKALMAYKF